MKFLPIIFLFCLSFNTKAEITIDEDVRVIVRTPNKATTENSNVKNEVTKNDEIKAFEDFKLEYESIITSSDVYSLFINNSKNAQIYSLKVTKDDKLLSNGTYQPYQGSIEHKIKLGSGIGLYN